MTNPRKSKAFIIVFIVVLLLLMAVYFIFKNSSNIFGAKNSANIAKSFAPLLGSSKQKNVNTIDNSVNGSQSNGNGTNTGSGGVTPDTNSTAVTGGATNAPQGGGGILNGNSTGSSNSGSGGTSGSSSGSGLGAGSTGSGSTTGTGAGTGSGSSGSFNGSGGTGSGSGFNSSNGNGSGSGLGGSVTPPFIPLPSPTGGGFGSSGTGSGSGFGSGTGGSFGGTGSGGTGGSGSGGGLGNGGGSIGGGIGSNGGGPGGGGSGNPTFLPTPPNPNACADDPLVFTDAEQTELDSLLKEYYLIAPSLKNADDITLIDNDLSTNQSLIDQANTLTAECNAEKANTSYTGPQTIKDNPYYQGVGSSGGFYIPSLSDFEQLFNIW